MEQNSKKDLVVTLGVLLAVVFIVTGVIIMHKKTTSQVTVIPNPTLNQTSSTVAPTQTTTQTDTTPAATANNSTSSSPYQDGSYTATASYYTPDTIESITVKIDLKNGIVTQTSAQATAHSRDSRAYSQAFIQNYSSLVVGKNINSIHLGRVSGASLTPQGFNDALSQIINQAKA